ncbi:unnamed protein product [Brugia pahangi]|uniref:Ell-associated factor Eaf n=1 Tax=Brugia pahangi TaxID=6280 RepID=A0A0N4TB95_BRUPA|nr:unnamed protein product [Brugia pahangi]
MTEVREIPSGTYNLKFGESFHERGEKPIYHTLQSVPGEGDALTVFKGAQKPVKGEKECLLFFDHLTGEMRIEKLSSVMSVKKTRYHFPVLLK